MIPSLIAGAAGLATALGSGVYSKKVSEKQLDEVKRLYNKKYLYDLSNKDMEKFFNLKDGLRFYEAPSLYSSYYPCPEDDKPVAELPLLNNGKSTNIFGLATIGHAKMHDGNRAAYSNKTKLLDALGTISTLLAGGVPIIGRATGLLKTNNQTLIAGGLSAAIAALINYKYSKFKIDNQRTATDNVLNYLQENYPDRYDTEKQILEASIRNNKASQLKRTALKASIPLMTAAATNVVASRNNA